MTIWKKDLDGNEYTSAKGAAEFLGMPRTTFMYYIDPKTDLPDNLRPQSDVWNLRTVYYKKKLEVWKNKTSKIKFKYKRNRTNTDNKESNVTNFPKLTKGTN